jgi:hypothetical protein
MSEEEARNVDEELAQDFSAAVTEQAKPFEEQNTPEQNALIQQLKATLEPLVSSHPDPEGLCHDTGHNTAVPCVPFDAWSPPLLLSAQTHARRRRINVSSRAHSSSACHGR